MKQKMITIGYSRIPRETEYRVKMDVDEVELTEGDQIPNALRRWTAHGIPMEKIIEELHHTLKDHPDARVTMIQEPSKGPLTKRQPRGFELDQSTIDLIRTDPEQAKEMFKPIERTVSVRPPRVTLQPKKENDNGKQAAE
jgi:hypothetical protein